MQWKRALLIGLSLIVVGWIAHEQSVGGVLAPSSSLPMLQRVEEASSTKTARSPSRSSSDDLSTRYPASPPSPIIMMKASSTETQHPQEDSSCHKLSHAELQQRRYLTFDPPGTQFGLTNQLITLAGAIHLALQMDRMLVFPLDAEPDFFDLLNVSETLRRLQAPCNFTMIHARQLVTMTDEKGKKFPRLHLEGRVFTAEHPHHAARLVRRHWRKHHHKRGMRLSTVMWHVPYTEHDQLTETEHHIFRSFVFSESLIVKQAKSILKVLRRKGEKDEPFLGLHLRLEHDIKYFRMDRPVSLPTVNRIQEWFRDCVSPAIQQVVQARKESLGAAPKTLYVAAGNSLPREFRLFLQGLATSNNSQSKELKFDKVVFRADIIGVIDRGWDSQHNATNHIEAAIDLLVMEQSWLPISADFSTFARAVQLRRCGNPRALWRSSKQAERERCPEEELALARAPLLTYNQDYGALTPRYCCVQGTLGLESTPFALLKDRRQEKDMICKLEGP